MFGRYIMFLGFDFTTTDFNQWSANILITIMVAIPAVLALAALLMTLLRLGYSLRREEQSYKQDCTTNSEIKSFIKFLKRDRQYQVVHITEKTRDDERIGICLEGGVDNPSITGDPSIFVKKVKRGSPAEGKLFPGDRILSVNDIELIRVPLRYAVNTVREEEGPVKFYVKRAQYRQRRIIEVFKEYNKNIRAVFTKQQIEEIEDGFSVYDHAGHGTIKPRVVMSLVRCLGYNLHESQIWVYMNELGFTANPYITLQDFVKLMHVIVTDTYNNDIFLAYSVFTENEGDVLTTSKLKQALKRMSERIRVKDKEIRDIIRLALGDKKEGVIRFKDFKKLVLPTMKLY